MNMHKNARMTPIGRERLVQAVVGGQRPEAAARAAGVPGGRCTNGLLASRLKGERV
jgi:hypothetical protein